MSSEPAPTTPVETDEALAADLIAIRNSLTTPESVGRALSYFVLTEAVRQGKRVDADTFEIPMTVTSTIVRRDTDKSSVTTITETVHHHITVFGHHLISWDTTHTTTTATSSAG